MCQMFRPSGAKLKRCFLFILLVMTVALLLMCCFLTCKRQHFFSKPLAGPPSQQTVRELTMMTENRSSDEMKCVHPPLHLNDPTIMQFYKRLPPVDCSSVMKDWVYVTNGTFRISRDAIRQHGNITCRYSPIFRRSDYSVTYGKPMMQILDGTSLLSDFFYVVCVSATGKKYKNYHASAAWNRNIIKRLRTYHSSVKATNHSVKLNLSSTPSLSLKINAEHLLTLSNLSIFVFGLDSMSRMGWHRNLPKTHQYFTHKLGAIELEKHNIMGPGTASALLPMFTGKMKEELPEARPGKGGKPIDNYPWIWKEFSKSGYVTAFGQDKPNIGAFNYNMRGFETQPTDHYMRTFYLATNKPNKPKHKHPSLCCGSQPNHVTYINWFGSLIDMYRDYPKFFVGHYVQLSHEYANRIQVIDDDLLAFVQELERKGHLNSTLLILCGDHGPRYGNIRKTAQGAYEMRLPYFSFRFPPWFHKLHPEKINTLKKNAKRLTTPLDIHATFLDILNYSNTDVGDLHDRAISLFREIPKERTCTHAGIAPHWCTCVLWEPVDASDPLVKQGVAAAIKTINSYTKGYRKKCAELKLQEITHCVRYVPSSVDIAAERKMLKFKNPKSEKRDNIHLYKASFKTSPGGGLYEVTCDFNATSHKFYVDENQISRTSKYGSQAACIGKHSPHLNPFCYCI